jgi:hypothetical protein
MLEFANRPAGSRSDAPGSKPALLVSFSRCLARGEFRSNLGVAGKGAPPGHAVACHFPLAITAG